MSENQPGLTVAPLCGGKARSMLDNGLMLEVFHRGCGILFFIASLPLYPVVGILIKADDGGKILYRGTRLGLHKKPFTILKFRTLPENAERQLSDSLLPLVNSMESRLGLLLRETRLDEIPQLWNVVRGEMHLVGPRPLRPSIHREIVKEIAAIDRRFSVRPGITGLAQFLTPYHTSKRLRSKLDQLYLSRKSLAMDAGLLFSTLGHAGLYLLRSLGQQLIRSVLPEWRLRGGVAENRRQLARRPVSGSVIIPIRSSLVAPIHDLNEQAVSFLIDQPVPDQILKLILETRTPRRIGRGRQRKIASCGGQVVRRRLIERTNQGSGTPARLVVVRLSPHTDLDHYKIEKYFLRKSMADR